MTLYNFTVALISLVLAVAIVFLFSSFFLTVSALLFLAMVAFAPAFALLLPIFFLYGLFRWLFRKMVD